MVSGLPFESLFHFEVIFVCGLRERSRFVLWHGLSTFPTPFTGVHGVCSFSTVYSCLLRCRLITPRSVGSVSCVYQYHTVLVTVTLCLKSGSVIFPAWFFLLKIVLAVQDLWHVSPHILGLFILVLRNMPLEFWHSLHWICRSLPEFLTDTDF